MGSFYEKESEIWADLNQSTQGLIETFGFMVIFDENQIVPDVSSFLQHMTK